ncbi:MAG: M23 family metallopeptidase [Alphaproteobacteria bacterium]|nr:M23 family metallopeptidase [Alphaproteobacteria bacterium]
MRAILASAFALSLAGCGAPEAAQTSLPVPTPSVTTPAPTPQPATPVAMPAPLPIKLECAGAFAQGGIIVCRTEIGARVIVDHIARGNADAEGWFVAGFDRDAPPTALIEVNGAGGAKQEIYAVAPRQFSIQRVDGLPPETVTPTDPAVLARIARDTEIKNKARDSRATLQGYQEAFVWPVEGRMSGAWGNQRVLNGVPKTPHYGIDIAATTGTPIRAPAPGVIALAERDLHFEGGLIMLDHGQGLMTYYLHMSRVDVAVGDTVDQAQVLGAVGRSGRTTGPHLCWRMRWRDRNLDPSLAIKGLAIARAHWGGRTVVDPGTAPSGFVQWAPQSTSSAQ